MASRAERGSDGISDGMKRGLYRPSLDAGCRWRGLFLRDRHRLGGRGGAGSDGLLDGGVGAKGC